MAMSTGRWGSQGRTWARRVQVIWRWRRPWSRVSVTRESWRREGPREEVERPEVRVPVVAPALRRLRMAARTVRRGNLGARGAREARTRARAGSSKRLLTTIARRGFRWGRRTAL